jgi:hypothetical protein
MHKRINRLLNRLPILLSAFVFPGSGQLLQKRWIAGSIIIGCFLITFTGVLIAGFKNIIAYYQFGLAGDDPEMSSPRTLITWFIIALILYIINLCDVLMARFRAHQLAETEMIEAHTKS